MKSHKFHDPGYVRAFTLDLRHNLDAKTLISVYHEWIEGLEQVIAMNGEPDFKKATEIKLYSEESAEVVSPC
jgi:hypothetical protein